MTFRSNKYNEIVTWTAFGILAMFYINYWQVTHWTIIQLTISYKRILLPRAWLLSNWWTGDLSPATEGNRSPPFSILSLYNVANTIKYIIMQDIIQIFKIWIHYHLLCFHASAKSWFHRQLKETVERSPPKPRTPWIVRKNWWK